MSLHVLSDSQLTKSVTLKSGLLEVSDVQPLSRLICSNPRGLDEVGGAGVTYYPRPPHLSVVLPSVDGAVIAAFSKVLLPLCYV